MALDDGLDDRQAKAAPPPLAAAGGFHFVKPIKHVGKMLRRNPRPVVANHNRDAAAPNFGPGDFSGLGPSTDYPFERTSDAAGWFDHTPISEPDRLKIGRTNGQRLLGLTAQPALTTT